MQGFGELDEIYRDTILDHYRTPRNADALEDPDVDVEVNNPFCGDEIRLQISLGDGDGAAVTGVSVSGRGCAISQSAGSLMGEQLEGRTIADIRELARLFRGLMMGQDLSEEDQDRLEDLMALEGVKRYPVRIKCALLAWSGLSDVLEQIEAKQGAG